MEDKQSSNPPLFAWLILFAAVIAVSSAGAVFQLMSEVPPLLRASWRLQATAMVLAPFCVLQCTKLRREDPNSWARLFEMRTVGIVVGSGVCLWLHFGTWVWSLDRTSLTHSLLFVTAHPLIFVVGSAALGKAVDRRCARGAVIGFLGAAITLIGVQGEGDVTAIGDAAAFAGAIAIVGYLIAGRTLRNWMPLFIYAFPVTILASLLLLISSLALEGTTISGEHSSLWAFGWTSATWLPLVAYLALGPGLVGHTGINAVLRWVSPLVISVSVLFEPIIGSLIGLMLGTSSVPGIWTWIGGCLLLTGMGMVILAEGTDHQAEASKDS